MRDLQNLNGWDEMGEQINSSINWEFSSAWSQAPPPITACQHALQKGKTKLWTIFQELPRLVATVMSILPEFGSAEWTDVLKAPAALEANSDALTFSIRLQGQTLTNCTQPQHRLAVQKHSAHRLTTSLVLSSLHTEAFFKALSRHFTSAVTPPPL